MRTRIANWKKDHAFTLLEVLAVLVILSSVAALALRGLASADAHAKFSQTVSRLRDMDARSRLTARSGLPVMLVHDAESSSIIIRTSPTGEVVSEFDIPLSLQVEYRSLSGEKKDAILIDRAGRSVDCLLLLEDGVRSRRFHVSGITGQLTEREVLP